MKKISIPIYILSSALSFSLISCHDSDTKPKGQFEKGVFVVNEGNYSDTDGSVSFYNRDNGETTQDLFGLENNGRILGSVVQSMTIDGDLAYVPVNNDKKMEVVNVNTFVSAYTLEDLKLPRYFTVISGKGYLTEWVNFTDSGRVSVIDLNKHTVVSSVKTDYGAENLVGLNGKLFVSNNFTNTVSVIDLSTMKVVKTITVGDSPGAFIVDKNNKLWVLCGGGSDVNYAPLNNGTLDMINPSTYEIEKTIQLNMNVTPKLVSDKNKENLYFFKGKSVYKIGINDSVIPSGAFISEAAAVGFYGIGVDPSTDIIYVGDAKAFNGNGTVYRYKNDGTAIDNFSSGRGPNGFVFK